MTLKISILAGCFIIRYLLLFSYQISGLLIKSNWKAQVMIPAPIPGSGQDGQQPFAPGDGLSWEDEDAWAARLMADADADCGSTRSALRRRWPCWRGQGACVGMIW